MKKIEKEEQLKKKLEQTMEEKMAADSKTVADNGNQVYAGNKSRGPRILNFSGDFKNAFYVRTVSADTETDADFFAAEEVFRYRCR